MPVMHKYVFVFPERSAVPEQFTKTVFAGTEYAARERLTALENKTAIVQSVSPAIPVNTTNYRGKFIHRFDDNIGSTYGVFSISSSKDDFASYPALGSYWSCVCLIDETLSH